MGASGRVLVLLILACSLISAGCSNLDLEGLTVKAELVKDTELDITANSKLLAKNKDSWAAIEVELKKQGDEVSLGMTAGNDLTPADMDKLDENLKKMNDLLGKWKVQIDLMTKWNNELDGEFESLKVIFEAADVPGVPDWFNEYADIAETLMERKLDYYKKALALYEFQYKTASARLDLAKQQVEALKKGDTAGFKSASDKMASATEQAKTKETELKTAAAEAKKECDLLEKKLKELAGDADLENLFAKTQ